MESMSMFVSVQPVTGDAATDTFRLKLLQYKARCYLMMHALKACKREIKNLITASGLVSIKRYSRNIWPGAYIAESLKYGYAVLSELTE
jgi:hypothetical protein